MKIDNMTSGINYGYTGQPSKNNQGRKQLGYEQYSGTDCQQTGQWQASLYSVNVIVSIQKGTVMPYHQSQPVKWKLVDYGVDKELTSSR